MYRVFDRLLEEDVDLTHFMNWDQHPIEEDGENSVSGMNMQIHNQSNDETSKISDLDSSSDGMLERLCLSLCVLSIKS